MVDGVEGADGQLPLALAEVATAVGEGRAVLATVLIGSNDLWLLYEGDGDEEAAAATYRTNLDRTVRELLDAGAVVVVGLPHDQSLIPLSRDIEALHWFFPNITEDEVPKMSAMSERLATIAEDIADAYGVRTVDTDAPFWQDTATMDEDLGHPNEAGYAALAELWIAVVQDLL